MKAKLIKEKDWYDLYRIDEDGKRVTFASTQDYKQKLSLKNCQAIERGYDLGELANEYYKEMSPSSDMVDVNVFKAGFQKALEILGDRRFSERDLDKVIEWGINSGRSGDVTHYAIDDFIQSLQQTEWEVEICCKMDCQGDWDECKNTSFECELCTNTGAPQLDADGCLILKRV